MTQAIDPEPSMDRPIRAVGIVYISDNFRCQGSLFTVCFFHCLNLS